MKSLGRNWDRQYSCEVSMMSRIAVKSLKESGDQNDCCEVSKKSLGLED